jgi:hypothetical protein
LNNNCRGNVADNPYHLSTIIKLPPKHIKEILKCKQDQSLVLASCQPPFHVEYVNKAWSDFCGWGNDDILGSSCGFLHGEETDMEIISAFTNDLKQTAYARMRIHNYDKDNNLFIVVGIDPIKFLLFVIFNTVNDVILPIYGDKIPLILNDVKLILVILVEL